MLRTICDPDWIQTNDLLLRRQLLYSTELPGHKFRTGRKDTNSGHSGEDQCTRFIKYNCYKIACNQLFIPLFSTTAFFYLACAKATY
jgi:hypothetical protein